MRIVARIGDPQRRCVPKYISLNWFFNRRPPSRGHRR